MREIVCSNCRKHDRECDCVMAYPTVYKDPPPKSEHNKAAGAKRHVSREEFSERMNSNMDALHKTVGLLAVEKAELIRILTTTAINLDEWFIQGGGNNTAGILKEAYEILGKERWDKRAKELKAEPLYTIEQVVEMLLTCEELTLVSVKNGFRIITNDEDEQGSWPATKAEVLSILTDKEDKDEYSR